jgi:hypothetical protein
LDRLLSMVLRVVKAWSYWTVGFDVQQL